ncbi:hypothetical protein N9174_02100 [bacterium]|nr:hypothetical protein [bacterium]
MKIGGITLDDVDKIAFGGNLKVAMRRAYLETALHDYMRVGMLIAEIEKIARMYNAENTRGEQTGYQGPVTHFDHHFSPLASSYYP